MSPETSVKEKTILKDLQVVTLADLDLATANQLAEIYYQSWAKEGLCDSLQTAKDKLSRFDPNQSFAVVDKSGKPYAMINSVLTDAADVDQLIKIFPTYASVEAAASKPNSITNPTYRICFSLTALPDFRVQVDQDQTISLSHYLINLLAKPVIVYSRWPAVPMHQHFGAQIVAVLDSRPEDIASRGQNVLLLYP